MFQRLFRSYKQKDRGKIRECADLRRQLQEEAAALPMEERVKRIEADLIDEMLLGIFPYSVIQACRENDPKTQP